MTSKLESKRDLIASPGPGTLQREKPPVSIEYCVPGNYERIATALSEAIETSLGESPELVPSRDGVFEVSVHGRVVFSKRACSRFPDQEEIFYHLRQL
ncbi:MAG: Rdx family protein [Planctomycetota bacterium]|nr:Rdx family protein [Planctomycetota bacterium]